MASTDKGLLAPDNCAMVFIDHLAQMFGGVASIAGPCAVRGHRHDQARRSTVPASDLIGFWGALGCSCWAI